MRANVMDHAIVAWADGSHDTSRTCLMCASALCSMPVHAEKYRIKIIGHIDPVELMASDGANSEFESLGFVNEESRKDAVDYVVARENRGEDDSNDD